MQGPARVLELASISHPSEAIKMRAPRSTGTDNAFLNTNFCAQDEKASKDKELMALKEENTNLKQKLQVPFLYPPQF
jgi:hypothetical protein